MAEQKKVADARNGSDGNISHVRFEGNERFTSVEKAVEMADQGKIENAHAVHPKAGDAYLRSNPDSKEQNNLDTMAED